MSDEREILDRSANGSFQFITGEQLEQSLDMPSFEFSSPISSIGSNCSSPERTIQPQQLFESDIANNNDSSDYVSLEDLKSQISPPSDGEMSGFGSSKKVIDVLETIFEDCYLETPPGTPSTPRPKKPRRARMNLNSFEEFKENVQNNHIEDK
jgi:hypothetical protein